MAKETNMVHGHDHTTPPALTPMAALRTADLSRLLLLWSYPSHFIVADFFLQQMFDTMLVKTVKRVPNRRSNSYFCPNNKDRNEFKCNN